MALLVQKYGGTSVGSLAHIRAIAERIQRTWQAGHRVVVVVSAMSGETDRLLHLAYEGSVSPDTCEVDKLIATGEIVSSALMAITLLSIGCRAVSLTGMQAGIVTDEAHTQARIKQVDTIHLRTLLEAGVVPVVAGFQGGSDNHVVTTLGRGGSDLSAVVLAAALEADLCEIYTDVDGVYNLDPRTSLQAYRLDQLSYAEMLVLARSGAKVLQVQAVEYAQQHDVLIAVKSSWMEKEGTGTLIGNIPYARDFDNARWDTPHRHETAA